MGQGSSEEAGAIARQEGVVVAEVLKLAWRVDEVMEICIRLRHKGARGSQLEQVAGTYCASTRLGAYATLRYRCLSLPPSPARPSAPAQVPASPPAHLSASPDCLWSHSWADLSFVRHSRPPRTSEMVKMACPGLLETVWAASATAQDSRARCPANDHRQAVDWEGFRGPCPRHVLWMHGLLQLWAVLHGSRAGLHRLHLRQRGRESASAV